MSAARAVTRVAMAILLNALAKPVAGQPADDVVMRAMRDELARSMQQLREGQLARPYFIAYTVHDLSSTHLSATGGSLVSNESKRARTLSVELRTGDYALDNTNFLAMPNMSLGGDFAELGRGLELPVEDNYLELRRQIWLATDAAYKRAAEALAAKRAALMNRARTDSLADFLKEPPTHTVEELPLPLASESGLDSLARATSKAADFPSIYSSSATVTFTNLRTRYVNSEGTTYTRARPLVMLHVSAATQATDGMQLADGVTFYARSLATLPPVAEVAARARSMALRLDSLRGAATFERYNGPVLFESHAAAELIEEDFGPALLGRRRMTMGSSEMEGFERMMEMGSGGLASFDNKLGARVLPEFLSVVDDPTRSAIGDLPLFGTYQVDEEGVPAQRTTLVEGGFLRSLLTTRTPVQGMDHSTGSRHGGGPAPSNLVVEARPATSNRDLVVQLMGIVSKRGLPYGIVVRELGGVAIEGPEQGMELAMSFMGRGGGRGARPLLAVYRVYPGGREELVRGVQLTDFTVSSFKDIVAASDSRAVYSDVGNPLRAGLGMAFSFLSGGGFGPPRPALSSYVVPALLFDDLTLTIDKQALPSPPFSPPPS